MARWMLVCLSALAAAVLPAQDQTKSSVEVIIEAPASMSPDVPAIVRVTAVRATGLYEFAAVEGAKVTVDLDETRVGEGATDKHGTVGVTVRFADLPEGERTLKVTTSCDFGKAEHQQKIKITRDARILITTDKPLYQPGQLVHIRTLALSGLSLKPVAREKVQFEIEDAKGNKVFKRSAETSEFGVSNLEFQLADEVNMGNYKLTASIGQATSHKSFEVKKYVLPKFKIDVKTDKKFYRPQETVKGTLEARYFYGKAVEKGFVTVQANTFDVQLREFAKIELKTNADGKCEFEFKLPDYFVGQPLEKGSAFVSLDVTVMDLAEHLEHADKRVTVCSQPVLLSLLPESGRLVTGVDNMVYVVASSPIGEPMPVDLKIVVGGKTIDLKTNDNGFATFMFVPQTSMMRAQWTEQGQKYLIDCQVTATEKGGSKTTVNAPLFADTTQESLLVRPDKGIYKTGEKIKVDILGVAKRDTIFFDVIRRGQTQLTDMVDLQDGRGHLELPIPQDLFGTIELHAYKIMKNGTIVRDTRVIFIEQTQSLSIKIDTDKEQYLPGDEATIRFQVQDLNGTGVQAALGVMVVDEAVYALQEMQPGLEKVYFMLEQEIMKPRYEIKAGGDLPGTIGMAEDGRRQDMAKILLANVEVPARRWQVNTLTARFQQATEKVGQVWNAVYSQLVSAEPNKVTRKNDKGERELLPDVVEISSKASGVDSKDPWGKPITVEKLEKYAGVKFMEYFTLMRSQGHVQTIWQAMEQYVVENDAVEQVNGAWAYKAGLLDKLVEARVLNAEYAKDGWGDAFTMERLAAIGAAFKPENIAALTDDNRKAHLFEALIAYALAGNVAVVRDGSGWKFKEGLLEQLNVKPGMRRCITTGKTFRLSELGAQSPAFKPELVLAETLIPQRVGVWNAILKAVATEGVGVVGTIQNGAPQYREDVLKVLIEKGYLKKSDIETPTGSTLGWTAIQGSYPGYFDLRAMGYTAAARKWNELYRLTRQFCVDKGYYKKGARGRQGRIAPPENLMQEMLDAKAITKHHLRDPFGDEIRFLVSKEKPFIQWEHEARFIDFVSCGPDGKFDTQDDYRFSQMNYQGYDSVQPPQRALYFQPDYQHVNRQLWNQPNDDAEGNWGGPRGGGAGGKGFGRGEMAQNGAPRPMAPPQAKAAEGKEDRGRMMEDLKKEKDGAADKPQADPKSGGGETFQEPTRIREWFPETLAWNPQIITDDKGVATMKLPIADSITSWRLSATANSKNALLGSATKPLVVFQDFFADIDFPIALTQNDIVSVPVAIFNYMKEGQKVKLEAEKGTWFEMLDEPVKIVDIGPNEPKAVYYKIKVLKIGNHTFTVKASGTKFSDAVRRSVEVLPDGKKFEEVINGKLPKDLAHRIEIPATSVEGASKIIVKVFPGVMAQLVDGLDGMLRLPGG